MKKIVLALGLGLAATTAALADSTALDAYDFPALQGSATIGYGAAGHQSVGLRYGDASPAFNGSGAIGIDYTATASIGSASNEGVQLRYGDASPAVR